MCSELRSAPIPRDLENITLSIFFINTKAVKSASTRAATSTTTTTATTIRPHDQADFPKTVQGEFVIIIVTIIFIIIIFVIIIHHDQHDHNQYEYLVKQASTTEPL